MKHFLVLISFICMTSMSFGQGNKRISGYVKDSLSGELLIGASIQAIGVNTQVSSKSDGYSAIHILVNVNKLLVTHVGYEDQIVPQDTTQHRQNSPLIPVGNILEEVVVSSQSAN